MAVVEAKGIDGLKALIGKQIGPGEWREVRQEDIDTFADNSQLSPVTNVNGTPLFAAWTIFIASFDELAIGFSR